MFVLSAIIFACSLFSFSDASYGHNLPRCSIRDEQCLKSSFQSIVGDIYKTGIPELGLPRMDPLDVRGVPVSVYNIITTTLDDGKLTGISDCVYDKFAFNLERKLTYQNITCKVLRIEGNVKLLGANSIIESILGIFAVNTEGKGNVKIEQMQMQMKAPFSIYRKHDGQIYMKMLENIDYFYKIGNAEFCAVDFYMAGMDIGSIGESYLNNNWRSIMEKYGPLFVDTAVATYSKLANAFTTGVPVNNYLTDDLSPYVDSTWNSY